ncbi:hypothetical protein [Microbacterium sp.]|uniref:hypothetical protein n=1 Tax=Microbacterium sp. TaxID=51671 RepID=UPI002810F099|nr:hypothetical protein [Microbacterium sp.]
MSDDLDIRYGGAIAVDTEVLRAVATRIAGVGSHLDRAEAAIRRAHEITVGAPGFSAHVDTAALWASGVHARDMRVRCDEASTGTLLMADAYELVELRAQAAAVALSDAAAAEALQLRIERLEASDERLAPMADMLVAGWENGRFDGLDRQFDLGGALSPLFLGGALVGARLGVGTVLPGMTLRGTADPVTVRPVATSRPVGPPTNLAEAFRRFPAAPDAQLKVERYTMPDGTSRYAAYIKGTQSFGYGGGDPWDMKSNKELYIGETSASYQATLDALAAAGAEPGDRVDVYAHSQAGMVAAHLAMGSEFDVQVQVTAGSPVEPTLRDDQLLIQLRHTDDVVSSLAGGGSPGGTGSPDSFIAERVGDSRSGVQDVWLATHWLDPYIETAEMVDSSGDVRLEGIRDSWRELGKAEAIEATEYRAERSG